MITRPIGKSRPDFSDDGIQSICIARDHEGRNNTFFVTAAHKSRRVRFFWRPKVRYEPDARCSLDALAMRPDSTPLLSDLEQAGKCTLVNFVVHLTK